MPLLAVCPRRSSPSSARRAIRPDDSAAQPPSAPSANTVAWPSTSPDHAPGAPNQGRSPFMGPTTATAEASGRPFGPGTAPLVA